MKNNIKILAFIGEAGAGKDTFMQEILKLRPDFHEIISCTSRPPRDGEVHGKNYYFYQDDTFKQKIEYGNMLEWTVFNNWYYGTSMDSIQPDKINIGVFNPAGIRSLMANQKYELDLIVVRVRAAA